MQTLLADAEWSSWSDREIARRCSVAPFSLEANTTHGKQRTKGDLERAYEIAERNALLDPTDPEAVMNLLRCSIRWARSLTQAARDKAARDRDAAIIAALNAKEAQRATAERLGVAVGTVAAVQKAEAERREQEQAAAEEERAQKRQSAETEPVASAQQAPSPAAVPATTPPAAAPALAPAEAAADEAPPEKPQPVSIALLSLDEQRRIAAGLARQDTPAARAWHAALEALREVNKQASVDALFADRCNRFDHVFGPELERAVAWIRPSWAPKPFQSHHAMAAGQHRGIKERFGKPESPGWRAYRPDLNAKTPPRGRGCHLRPKSKTSRVETNVLNFAGLRQAGPVSANATGLPGVRREFGRFSVPSGRTVAQTARRCLCQLSCQTFRDFAASPAYLRHLTPCP